MTLSIALKSFLTVVNRTVGLACDAIEVANAEADVAVVDERERLDRKCEDSIEDVTDMQRRRTRSEAYQGGTAR